MDLKPPVDLKVLYYFTVLAEEKHFGQAAKRIGIEQPPLSLQIKKLESMVGALLFDRSSRQIRLTPVGETLLPEAYKLLEQSIQLMDRLRSLSRGETGTLHIGFATSTIFSGLTAAIQTHKKRYPKVELRLQELSSAAQTAALQAGTIDIGFIREAGHWEGIACHPILKERFVAVLSAKHPLAKKKELALKDLQGEPFVHFPRSVAPALYDKVHTVFVKGGFYPNIVQEAMEWQTIVSLVEANLGVSICPASFQKLLIGKVQYRPLSDVKTLTSISMCFSAKNESKLIEPFLKVVNEEVVTL
ncbi:MAG TPA: LysR substrate-binding domain-containing protein [Flavisolibacter sp.]|jgi:DNA-binding transcriptional LysR family regulator|nr:LysR substrate-binding domain-containing protein [Flavisolibacter sp.]